MTKLLWVLALIVVAAVAGCGNATGPDDRFTQIGAGMEPAVKAGQVITIRAVERDFSPKRGDIVVFRADGPKWGGTKPWLSRVIAVGGEEISCCDSQGRVYINGTPLEEPYVVHNAPMGQPRSCDARSFAPVKVAEGDVFVMGDNRAKAIDSRCAGTIPATSVFAVPA